MATPTRYNFVEEKFAKNNGIERTDTVKNHKKARAEMARKLRAQGKKVRYQRDVICVSRLIVIPSRTKKAA